MLRSRPNLKAVFSRHTDPTEGALYLYPPSGAERSGAERSGAERSGAERSGAERSGAEREERSGAERERSGASGAERSGAERSRAERSGAERSGRERSGAERSRADPKTVTLSPHCDTKCPLFRRRGAQEVPPNLPASHRQRPTANKQKVNQKVPGRYPTVPTNKRPTGQKQSP